MRVMVSNYPGTSLELMRGKLEIAGAQADIIDTPGVYSLALAQAEETITREAITSDETELIINVVDASNLARNLVLTLELIEVGKPMVVLLNQMDRARSGGISINLRKMSRILGCPVFAFSALTGEGVMEVLDCIQNWLARGISSPRGIREVYAQIIGAAGATCNGKCADCRKLQSEMEFPDEAVWLRHQRARALAELVSARQTEGQKRWLAGMETLIDHPILGTLFLILLMYLGFKILVGFTVWAEDLITSIFVPVQAALSKGLSAVLPPGFWSRVLSKGVPEGLLIPIAVVMPAMLMVSFLMSLLEDTGLLARYAVVLERVGGMFGVSGQGVIPLTLGFGCRTPAVVASRILPSAKQRFIIITLLSIVIPCAATLGIITSVIANFHASTGVVVATMLAVFLALGWGLKTVLGERNELVYELPPLRIPLAANLWSKVRMRFSGFFTEVLPLLVLMSIAVRVLIDSGVMERLHSLGDITGYVFGIPAEAFMAVLITVVQKYLAPLVLLNLSLTPREATIAVAMIALSMPCLPVIVIAWREVGARSLLKIIGMGFVVSFSVGIILNLVLPR